MDFEWDPTKATVNLRKHRVRLADAVAVFHDEMALTLRDEAVGEERHVTMGMDALARVLVVVWTQRARTIRLISARKATAREQAQYMEGL